MAIALNSPELRSNVPAIFASNPDPKVSENYTFVPTMEVLRILDSQGWEIHKASQQKTRNSGAAEFTKHMLSLRHPDLGGTTELGGLVPQITLINSHDWSSKFKIIIGIFRLLCTNGLIAACGDVLQYNVRHDRIHEDISTVMARIGSASHRLIEKAGEWDSKRLSDEQVMNFAREATSYRFPQLEGSDRDAVAERMQAPRRSGDLDNTLWNVYNRVQENGIRGGFRLNRRSARELTNIANNVRFNQQLWALAETYSLN